VTRRPPASSTRLPRVMRLHLEKGRVANLDFHARRSEPADTEASRRSLNSSAACWTGPPRPRLQSEVDQITARQRVSSAAPSRHLVEQFPPLGDDTIYHPRRQIRASCRVQLQQLGHFLGRRCHLADEPFTRLEFFVAWKALESSSPRWLGAPIGRDLLRRHCADTPPTLHEPATRTIRRPTPESQKTPVFVWSSSP